MIKDTLSILRWQIKTNVTYPILFETESDSLDSLVCSIYLPLCHCASLIFATHKFFYSLSLGDDDESYVNYRLTEVSLVTLQIVYI